MIRKKKHNELMMLEQLFIDQLHSKTRAILLLYALPIKKRKLIMRYMNEMEDVSRQVITILDTCV